ncbi:hypothetical protein Hanom_Chr11g01018971 [Helianthus anomalus]
MRPVTYGTCVPRRSRALVGCHRVGPKCVLLRSKHRLPFVLNVALSHVGLQP